MLDALYISASDLESYFVDKDTGLPLSGGQIFFYSDENRSMLKPIYTISGSAPNYSYIQLPNPLTLSAVGTIQDASNNNVPLYYYPYNTDGDVELYYIVVKSAGGVVQFTREAWPPNVVGSSESSDANGILNFIPNGQFLLHNNIPANILSKYPAGQITQPITQIAQGGWTFERPSGSAAIDNVSFFRYAQYVTNPTDSPRYACRIICQSPSSSDSFKDLRIKFDDVNKFSSEINQFTFSFTAATYSSGDFPVNLNIIKNFGTGGSPSSPVITTLAIFNITGTEQIFSYSFSFGDNSTKNIFGF